MMIKFIVAECRAKLFGVLAMTFIIFAAAPAAAVSPLGTAANHAVLGGATVTNTGATTIFGDIGVYPGTALTGAASITQTGAVHLGDAVAGQALADANTAFALFAGLPIGTDLTGLDLGNVGPLQPGTYSFASSAQLTGNLLLDFTSNPGGRFLFRIGSALTTASGAAVNVLGGNSGSGIFWNVGSSATLGTGTMFAGNILADQSITLNSGASILCGRAIALIGAVTMDGNIISNGCGGSGNAGTGRSDFGSAGFAAADPVPEPASWAMLIIGLGAAGITLRRRRLAFTA